MEAGTAKTGAVGRVGLSVRSAVYAMFFMSGFTALIFEIVWTQQFVTVFGGSTYAVTTVLCAFMAGLGLGSLWFGRIADRCRHHLLVYALIEAGIAVSALMVPVLLAGMRWLVPVVFSSASGFALLTLVRFGFSFLVLFIPCFLMGGILPVLGRFCSEHRHTVGARISLLYGLNVLGSAAGCFAAGFYFIETLGLSATNRLAVGGSALIMAAAFLLWKVHKKAGVQRQGEADESSMEPSRTMPAALQDSNQLALGIRPLLLGIALVSGFASLCCEVLWVRHMSFAMPNSQYSFASILGVYLLGLGAGSLIYRLLLARRPRQLLWLAALEMALGPIILLTLLVGTEGTIRHGIEFLTRPLGISSFALRYKTGAIGLAATTMFLPTVVIGIVLPLIYAAFPSSLSTVGRGVGAVSAVNTVGCMLGSLAPVAVLVPLLGIHGSIYALALVSSAAGVLVLAAVTRREHALRPLWAVPGLLAVFGFLAWLMPGGLTQKLFLSTLPLKGAHKEITFYREGRTATVMIVRDSVLGFKDIYINRVEEVPTWYMGHCFFKLFGTLGPLLHPHPDTVLALCLGGGISSGTAIQSPDVRTLVGVDIVPDMLEACALYRNENNDLVDSDKFEAVIEDARNYLLMTSKQYPVIFCDSTHPSSPDSWILYTREFYETVKSRLAPDGLFLQWLPTHRVPVADYKIIAKTFQSVFPHTSIWMVCGSNENGMPWMTTLLLGTAQPLKIDVESLSRRLSEPAVRHNLERWDLHKPVDLLETFLCAEDAVRRWTAGQPINTDDLPYSQYRSGLSRGVDASPETFVEVLQSIWPFLSNTGDEQESRELKVQLDRHLEAKRLWLLGRTTQAIAALPECGKMRSLKQNMASGAAYLRRIAADHPDDAEILTEVADSILMLRRGSGPNSDEHQEAIRIYEHAVALSPDRAAARMKLAPMLCAAGRPDEAIQHLNRVIQTDPDDADAHAFLGLALMQKGRLEDAASRFKQAIAIKPDWALPYNSLGTILQQRGYHDEAMRYFEQAVSLDPFFAEGHNSLGRALIRKGMVDSAIMEFRQAVSIRWTFADARANLGRALFMKGRFDAAMEEWRQALLADPNHGRAHNNLGHALEQKGELQEAIAHYRQAINSSPPSPEAYHNLGAVFAAQGKPEQAIEVLREGMTRTPALAIANCLARLLATCPQEGLRDGTEAVELAERACELTGQRVPEILDTLAAAYAETGQFDRAVETAERAVELALQRGNAEFADQVKHRLQLYRAQQPYRAPP